MRQRIGAPDTPVEGELFATARRLVRIAGYSFEKG